MSRYKSMFEKLSKSKRIAFIPFVTIGDPNFNDSKLIVKALIKAGADALELGIPFSDPIADGPTIQMANERAFKAKMNLDLAFEFIKQIRSTNPEIPIGILVYTNLVLARGQSVFFKKTVEVGVDSVLLVDTPLIESEVFVSSARSHSLDYIFIAPPNLNYDNIPIMAQRGSGYTYVMSRSGTTGADLDIKMVDSKLIAALKAASCAPPVLGFGISNPEHITKAKMSGLSGAIVGSAIVKIIEQNLGDISEMLSSIGKFAESMKAKT